MIDKLNLEQKLKERFPTEKLEVPINQVKPNDYNPNIQTDEMFQKELASIKEFGFIQPILVRQIVSGVPEYTIVDGEHRWRACKELGYEKILVENLGELDESSSRALTLIMNNLRGKDNVIKRAEMLKEINEGQLSLLPWDANDIEEELKLLGFNFEQFARQDSEEKVVDNFDKALKQALMLEDTLRQIYENEERGTKLRLACETFFDFVRMLKTYIVNK